MNGARSQLRLIDQQSKREIACLRQQPSSDSSPQRAILIAVFIWISKQDLLEARSSPRRQVGGPKSREVPPRKGRDHEGKECPGGDTQTKSHSNGRCGDPRKRKREGYVRRNGDLKEALVPPAKPVRSFHDFDERPQDHVRKAQRNNEPTNSTVPGICEIKARDDS